MPKDASKSPKVDDQKASVNIESALDCGRDFAKTLSKVMTKTSDRLMALLQEELERLDKLDAENGAICEVPGENFTLGIKPEGNASENGEVDSPVTKCDEPREELPLFDEAGSHLQASDRPKIVNQVSMSDKLGSQKHDIRSPAELLRSQP